MFKKSRKAREPPKSAVDPIRICLADDDRAFDPNPDVHIPIEGFSPYLDEALTIQIDENQDGFAAEGIVYSRIVGGTHHQADLQSVVFDLASKVGLVGLVREVDNAYDLNAIAARGVARNTIYTAGYLPRRLAAALTPRLGPKGITRP